MSLLDKQEIQTFVGTLHCALENGADLYVNEHQKIRYYHARSTEERRRRRRKKNNNAKSQFFYFAWCVHIIYCVIIAMLYTHSI